jgi:hypothetical protein
MAGGAFGVVGGGKFHETLRCERADARPPARGKRGSMGWRGGMGASRATVGSGGGAAEAPDFPLRLGVWV